MRDAAQAYGFSTIMRSGCNAFAALPVDRGTLYLKKYMMDMKTLIRVILIICSWSVRDIETQNDIYYAPELVPWYAWTFHLSNQHLTDMSAEMVRDATYKLEIAYKIQGRYRSAFAYQIGIITNAIHKDFERMLAMYRDYSNLTKFRNRARGPAVFLQGFHVMQGIYNKIRFHKSIFTKMLQKRQAEKAKLMNFLKANNLLGPAAGGRRTENLNLQLEYNGQTPRRIHANTTFGKNNSNLRAGNSNMKPGNSNMKLGNSNMKPGNYNMKPSNSIIKPSNSNMKPGLTYREPEKSKEFVRPSISLGGHYSGPYQGLPAAKMTKRTTKQPLWKHKILKY